MSKRHSTKGKRKQAFRLKLPKETIYTLASTGLILIGGLIMVSLSRQRPFLELIYSYIYNLFGWAILLLPFIFLSAGLMLTRLKWRITKPNVFVGSLVLLLSFTGLTRAGLFGRQIWQSLVSLIFSAGAFLVLIAGVFISLVIIFETSLEDILLMVQKTWTKLKNIKTSLKFKTKSASFDHSRSGFTVKGLDTDVDSRPSLQPAATPKKPPLKVVSTVPVISNTPGAQQEIWHYPPLSLLSDTHGGKADRGDVKQSAAIIETTLESFGIKARVAEVNNGPAVTQYAIEIASGTRLSKITSLQNNLALALAAPQGQIRIEAPIPGRSLVGLEIPNRSLEIVPLKKMLESKLLKNTDSRLAVALGLDVSGQPIITDIDRMPHVLIAGATGSGKSVCINTIIATLLYRASPQ